VFERFGDEGDWPESKTIFVSDEEKGLYLKDKRAWLMKKGACIKYLEV